MLELALWLKKNGFRADQVQTFLPGPMATATAMYHTRKNPLRKVTRESEEVVIPKGIKQRRAAQGLPALSRPEQLAGAARGATPDGPRRPDRQRQAASWYPSYQPAGTGDASEGKGRGGSAHRPFKTQHTGLPRLPRAPKR